MNEMKKLPTPAPLSTVPGGTPGYETTSYGIKHLESAPTVQVPENLACEVKAQTVVSGVPSEAAPQKEDLPDVPERWKGRIKNWLPAHDARIRREAEAKDRVEFGKKVLEMAAQWIMESSGLQNCSEFPTVIHAVTCKTALAGNIRALESKLPAMAKEASHE